jgi:hypothetical protein
MVTEFGEEEAAPPMSAPGTVIAGGLIALAVVGLIARRITQLARLDA